MNYRRVKGFIESADLSKLDERVLEALHSRRIIKLVSGRTSIWVFNGRERDYLIVPRIFCSCMDFELNVIIRGTKRSCYHLVAQYIAELRNAFRVLEVDDATLGDTLVELAYSDRSLTLRRLLTSKLS